VVDAEPIPTSPLTAMKVSASNIAATRASLIAAIWSGNGYPAAGADTVETDVDDPLTISPANLLRVDQLTVNMDDNDGNFVMANTPHVWYPAAEDANGKLAFVSYGHLDEYDPMTGYGEAIRALVENGYTVFSHHMPSGGHGYPAPTPTLNYLKFFLEPLARTINELVGGFNTVYSTGKSGGGWAVTLAAAIDTRIGRSAPVAGSLPLYVPVPNRDWEQTLPGIAALVDYHDLHAMAADGGRSQKQILNTYDSCCFNLAQFNWGESYVSSVQAVATAAGGTFALWWDDTHTEHLISDAAIVEILTLFNSP